MLSLGCSGNKSAGGALVATIIGVEGGAGTVGGPDISLGISKVASSTGGSISVGVFSSVGTLHAKSICANVSFGVFLG